MIKCFVAGPVSANTYVLKDDATGEVAVIDCGECTAEIVDALKGENVKYILLTHGHFDHINGVYELKSFYPEAKLAIHSLDAECLNDDALSMGRGFGICCNEKCDADILLYDNDTLKFGNSEIKVLHTPGHTQGGVAYMYENNLFTGDTLFYRSVGRTDFPGGSFPVLHASVTRLFSLEGDYKVYPGHDKTTTLEIERKLNPYINWRKK